MALFVNKNEATDINSVVVSRAVESGSPTGVNRVEAPSRPGVSAHSATDVAWHEVAKSKRRVKGPLGIQGKLLLAFFAIMSAALGLTCVLYSKKVHERFSQQLQEQASTIANALAQATLSDYKTRDLRRVGEIVQRLVNTSEVMVVAFHDAQGQIVVTNTRGNVPFDASHLEFKPTSLAKVEPSSDPRLGELYRVTVPVLVNSTGRGNGGILGYVTVGVSRNAEGDIQAFLGQAVIGVGAGMMLLAMPLAWLLLRSTFAPVNSLVAATKRIIGGELDTFVPVDGDDAVAQLAKSFNELVTWVKQHRAQIDTANKMLEEANHELERKIEHRTVQLESSNERLSTEIAEKEDFLRAISHDLNAPLRNIGGTVAMIMMKHKAHCTPEMVEKLDRIKRNVEIQTDLINELLELSRIGRVAKPPEGVDLSELVQQALLGVRGRLAQLGPARGSAVQFVVAPDLPTVQGDPVRLLEVLQNLLDNALKFSSRTSQPRIEIGHNRQGDQIAIYVRDNGVGIESQYLERVFELFEQLDPAVAGTGIGLTIVKRIVEVHGGRVWAESPGLGAGATIFFTLPVEALGSETVEKRSLE